MRKDKFKRITGYDAFDKVWAGIMAAHNAGFYPIKINVVALAGINDDEFLNFAKLSLNYPFWIRFIEYMPIGSPIMDKKKKVLGTQIKKNISRLGKTYFIRT